VLRPGYFGVFMMDRIRTLASMALPLEALDLGPDAIGTVIRV
jgi:hypothetical protein